MQNDTESKDKLDRFLGSRITTAIVSVVVVAGLGVAVAAGNRSRDEHKAEMEKVDTGIRYADDVCGTAEKLFDRYSEEIADGVVSSVAKHRQQAQRLRLMRCPNWRY